MHTTSSAERAAFGCDVIDRWRAERRRAEQRLAMARLALRLGTACMLGGAAAWAAAFMVMWGLG